LNYVLIDINIELCANGSLNLAAEV